MRWLKKHKHKIGLAVQCFLVLASMASGFFNGGMSVCILIGLPIGWSALIGLIFSLLSTYGLIWWITNMKEDDMT